MPYARFRSLMPAALVGCAVLLPQIAPAQQPRRRGEQRIARPRQEPLRAEKLSPELERVLAAWEKASGRIERLYGSHYRYTYDSVFQVEKRAKGNFWFQAPDKGRIDIEPVQVKPGTVNPDKRGKDRKPYTVKPDAHEQWISTGAEIQQVNHEDKTIDVFPLPEELQGKNIVEGPLPFLFGMKAEAAKRRYKLKLGALHNKKAEVLKGRRFTAVHILAEPKLKRDAANWSKADVLLDARTYYPAAIKLLDPAGTTEQVYAFYNVREPSAVEKIFRNPFKLFLPGYKRVVVKRDAKQPGRGMPDLTGRGDWQNVNKLLQQRGFEVKVNTGEAAPTKELEGHIYRQQPAPNQPLQKGQTIVLTIYGRSRKAGRIAARGMRMPSLVGQFWKTARKEIAEKYGCEVSFRKGVPAQSEDDVYHVYQQSPRPGEPLKEGQKVTLTLYVRMSEQPSNGRTDRSSAKPPRTRQQ